MADAEEARDERRHGTRMIDEARLLRMGFENGVFTRADVRAWVDRRVAALDHLSPELLELATIAHVHDLDVINLLRALEAPIEPGEEARAELAVLATLLDSDAVDLGYCIEHLYALTFRIEGFTAGELSAIHSFEAGYYLAVEGTYGSIDQLEADLRAFLASYRLTGELRAP